MGAGGIPGWWNKLHQRRKQTERQKQKMAEMVSEGWGIIAAGQELGVGERRALAIWKKIKNDLGWQAV